MERYLSFELSADDASQSDFAAYSLGSNDILPHYFGGIAPINIFLGENNSGKSRFMRAIMKCNPTKVFAGHEIDGLLRLIDSAQEAIKKTSIDELYNVDITFYSRNSGAQHALEFLSISEQDLKKESQFILNFNPSERIQEYNNVLNTLNNNIAGLKPILNFINHHYAKQLIEKLTTILASINRANKLYQGLWDKRIHGFSPSSTNGRGVYYSSGHGSLTIHLNDAAMAREFAHNPNRVKEYGEKMSKQLVLLTQSISSVISELRKLPDPVSKNRDRTYIPTLRTARTLARNGGVNEFPDLFSATIINDYELKDSKVAVHTGLALYNAIDEKKNSEINDREEFERFEHFLSETFFNGKPVRVVPNRRKINILVAVDREERALPHLGDGIQAIILLLYPLFIAHKEAWFFIEEPETHLHPGFQRLFIKTIATHPVLLQKKLTIFLTTHSNHLLDFALDEAKNINLFTFRKTLVEAGKSSYQVQLTEPHDLACLNALGVQNSSVFLSNCTIWVEGITDRIYLKAYLRVYLGHRKQTFSLLEGLHYSFLEYAGANVSHYAFGASPQRVTVTDGSLRDIQALSISSRIMLIADQDAGKETKHERLTSQQHTGFEYVVLPTREIENLLTPEVIVAALKKLYPKQADHFNATQLKQGLYKSTYLARHLQSKFTDLPASFVADSGTIASTKKRQFAEAAADAITAWDMLSDDAKRLTEQAFKFIMGHNPRLGSN